MNAHSAAAAVRNVDVDRLLRTGCAAGRRAYVCTKEAVGFGGGIGGISASRRTNALPGSSSTHPAFSGTLCGAGKCGRKKTNRTGIGQEEEEDDKDAPEEEDDKGDPGHEPAEAEAAAAAAAAAASASAAVGGVHVDEA
jgi:hypothetical protein